MTTAVPDEAPRSLADALRAWPDERLVRLLQARPDLAVPVPPDLSVLASRAAVRVSIGRVLESLNAQELILLETLSLSEGPLATVDPAVDHLFDLALVWGDRSAVNVVGVVRDVLTAAGLGRPLAVLLADASKARMAALEKTLGVTGKDAVLTTLTDPDKVQALLTEGGEGPRRVALQLTAGLPRGTLRDALTIPEQIDSPVRWLVAHGILVPVDNEVVELPREIGLMLRGEPQAAAQPELATTKLSVADIDRAGAHEGADVVVRVTQLLESWSDEPPGVLRSGGLGVRELKRTAKDIDTSEATAALLVEIAYAAGLVDQSPAVDAEWVPTSAFDRWLALPPEDRWLELVRGWLPMTRLAALVGTRDRDRADKAVNALSPEVEWAGAPTDRRRVLDLMLEVPPGRAVTSAVVHEVLRWRAPRRGGRFRDDLPGWNVNEMAVLGLTGRGGLTGYARLLLEGRDREAAKALSQLLPEPLDHVLVQPDLTVVAPGPLQPDLARDLALTADVESTGGATVYRITEATVRRALDAGRSGSDLHELFRSRSRTGVPQSLTYLIDDVSRRHGRLRVGSSTSYLRCDDEALLSEVMASKRTSSLGLRRLAPTVVTSTAAINHVLEVLRGLGYAPAAEAPDGALLIARAEARRTAVRQRPTRHAETVAMPDEQAKLAVGALRAGDLAARASRRAPVSVSSVADASAFLAQAIQEGQQIWLGYVDAQGRPTSRVVEPRTIEGGYVTAYDHLRQEDRTFSLHRITGVAEIENP